MGNGGLTRPRLLLESELQLHFKRANVNQEVTAILSGWFEDGAPLGLTLEMFRQVLALQGQQHTFFQEFDTDMNQKVDAFELLSAYAMLSGGSMDEKIEVVLPIFDFAGTAKLNFDEANILIHSVCRGVRKVCVHLGAKVDDNDVIQVCRRLFDAHNLPYDQHITKDQLRRWLRSDVEASSFLDIFHNSIALPDAEASLARHEELQAKVFSQLSTPLGLTSIPLQELLQSESLRQSVGNPSDEAYRKLLVAMGGGSPLGADTFAKGARAWNVFCIVDCGNEGELNKKELYNLLYFQQGQAPSEKAIADFLATTALTPQGCITRSNWIEAVLQS